MRRDVVVRLVEQIRRFSAEQLWSREPLRPLPLAWGRHLLQISILIVKGFVRDLLLLRAHSLTFLTVLSLIPMLALAVSMTQLFGVKENLTRLMLEQIAAGSPEAVEWLLPLVEGLRFGALGTVGGIESFHCALALSGREILRGFPSS